MQGPADAIALSNSPSLLRVCTAIFKPPKMLEVRKEFLIFCVWVTRNLMGLKLKAADRDTIEVNKRNLASISVCLGLETNVTTFFWHYSLWSNFCLCAVEHPAMTPVTYRYNGLLKIISDRPRRAGAVSFQKKMLFLPIQVLWRPVLLSPLSKFSQ